MQCRFSGVSTGFESSVWSILVIGATIFVSILVFGGISGVDFEQFTVTAKPFRVREITMHKGNVEYQEGVHPDSSLKIALELVNIERAQLL